METVLLLSNDGLFLHIAHVQQVVLVMHFLLYRCAIPTMQRISDFHGKNQKYLHGKAVYSSSVYYNCD